MSFPLRDLWITRPAVNVQVMSTAQPEGVEPLPWARQTGRKVRGQLAEHEMNQADAARVLGLSQAAVSRRLTGDVDFTVTELVRLAQWLRIPLGDLLPTVLVAVGTGPAPGSGGAGDIGCSRHRDRRLRLVPPTLIGLGDRMPLVQGVSPAYAASLG